MSFELINIRASFVSYIYKMVRFFFDINVKSYPNNLLVSFFTPFQYRKHVRMAIKALFNAGLMQI